MVTRLKNSDKVWVEGVLETVGAGNVTLTGLTEYGFTLTYDPQTLTVHQANEMMSIAERDGRFSDYGVNVEKNTIFFNY